MVGHQDVAGRALEVAGGDLAGWGGFATVLTGLLALAAGSGWSRALMLLCLGALATTALWSAAALGRRAHGAGREPEDTAVERPGGEPPVTA